MIVVKNDRCQKFKLDGCISMTVEPSWAESNQRFARLGISTCSSFVPTARNLQPNQIAAFKWETLQLNLADKASWDTVFL